MFSGKDSTKVDRSASYMTRYVAKNIVAAGVADRIEIQIAYAIGKANPISIFVDTFGTGKIPDDEIEKFIEKELIEKIESAFAKHKDERLTKYKRRDLKKQKKRLLKT